MMTPNPLDDDIPEDASDETGDGEAMQVRTPQQVSLLREFLELISSMRFAVALLVLICVASVIGTVIVQNQLPVRYVEQFGWFWASFFDFFDLFAVFGSSWFLLILVFLVVSTVLCIVRHAPKLLKDMRSYREQVRPQDFAAMPEHLSAESPQPVQALLSQLASLLHVRGWRAVVQTCGNGVMVAARKGSAGRMGYLLAHGAIVLICLGGLVDGNMWLRIQLWLGVKSPFTGEGLVANIAPEHRLSTGNLSYRGNIFLPEGTSASVALLPQTDGGVLVQELPFRVELKRFTTEYYADGQVKRYASDVVIHDPASDQPLSATIEVNAPLTYKGISLYQSSFDDGGSTLTLTALPLEGGERQPLTAVVGSPKPFNWGMKSYQFEVTAFQPHNMQATPLPVSENTAGPSDDSSHSFWSRFTGAAELANAGASARDMGPSFTYTLTDDNGQKRSFEAYAQPQRLSADARVPVYVFGVQAQENGVYGYLRIPADAQGSMQEWMRLRSAFDNPLWLTKAVTRYVEHQVAGEDTVTRAAFEASVRQTLETFTGTARDEPGAQAGAGGGMPALMNEVRSRVPPEQQEAVATLMLRVVGGVAREAYGLIREQDGLPAVSPEMSEEDLAEFLTLAVMAYSDARYYPAPMLLTLDRYQLRQASILQATRAPGRWLVYPGCVLLIAGVFMMLFVRQRRLWVWLEPTGETAVGTGVTRVELAYSSSKRTPEGLREFTELRQAWLAPSSLPHETLAP